MFSGTIFITARLVNTADSCNTEAYNDKPASHVEVSPLLAESFAGLPPAYIQVAGGDPLRDDGLCYAQRLEEDGVPVKLDMSVIKLFRSS